MVLFLATIVVPVGSWFLVVGALALCGWWADFFSDGFRTLVLGRELALLGGSWWDDFDEFFLSLNVVLTLSSHPNHTERYPWFLV